MVHHLASVFLLLSLAAGIYCVPLSWQHLADQGLARTRWFAGAAFHGGQLYVFGGESEKTNTNDTGLVEEVNMLNTASATPAWTRLLPTVKPSPRYGFIGGVIGNYWIITHGCDLSTCFTETWAVDLSSVSADPSTPWFRLEITNSSSNASQPIPEGRFTTAGGVFPGTEYLWLSMGQTKSGRKLSDTWVLEISLSNGISGSWRLVSAGGGLNQYHPFLPHARFLHAGSPINTSTFAIFGGCASGSQVGGACPLQDSWTLDLDSGEWSTFPLCAPGRVRSSMVPVLNRPGRAYVFGGSQNYTPGIFPQQIVPMDYNDTEMYLMNTLGQNRNFSDWKRVTVLGPVPGRREGASFAVDASGGAVYLVGGRLLDKTYVLDVWRLVGDGDFVDNDKCPAPQLTFVHMHGLFMYVAWGLLLPLGTLLGRYYRWTWPCWFIFHIIFQSFAVLLTVAGFVIIFLVGSYTSPDFPHAIIGIVLTFLMIQQFFSGIFHPCVDKENGKTPSTDKSAYRKCWEVYHAVSGFITMAVGFGQLMLGALLVTGPPILLWAIWAGLGCLWIITFILHECIYLCCKLAHRRKRVY